MKNVWGLSVRDLYRPDGLPVTEPNSVKTLKDIATVNFGDELLTAGPPLGKLKW